MKICPITYEEIKKSEKYSLKGLHQLSSALKELNDFPYTAEEQRKEALARSSKLSIQGIQPKLSVVLSIKDGLFKAVDHGGKYILKPQVESFNHLPENEDVTMRLARIAGIEVPLHGLTYSKDGSLTYFIRRFDRKGQKDKIHIEDFAQLSGESRDTKYESSMEQVAKIVNQYCTFPVIERLKLFERTIFSFLVGNEDMHLKNFSLIVRNEKVELSPAYDLVNSTLALGNAKEELALSIRGKKSKLKREDLVDYFALEKLQITTKACESSLEKLSTCLPQWHAYIEKSFLPKDAQKIYLGILEDRANRLVLR
jgi:serine/threonine-protein kinase HipA